MKEEHRKIKFIAYADYEYNGILDWITGGLSKLKEVYAYTYEDMRVPKSASGLDKICVRLLYPSLSIPKLAEVFKKYLGSKHSYGLDFEIGRERIKSIRKIEEIIEILQKPKILTKSEARKEWRIITKKNIDYLEERIGYLEGVLKGYERVMAFIEEEIKKDVESGKEVEVSKISYLNDRKKRKPRLEKKISRLKEKLEKLKADYYGMGKGRV